MKLITEQEVFEIAFNRTMSVGLIKSTHISIATEVWFGKWVSDEFYEKVVFGNEGEYDDFIDEYVKPILAFGILHDNFHYITTQLTDKGLIQLVSEGAALISNNGEQNQWEIRALLFKLVRKMHLYAEWEKSQNNQLFLQYNSSDISPYIMNWNGNTRLNLNSF